MKRHYFKFQSRFVDAVERMEKRCTIRATRKRVPETGETAVLETWTGRPYGSAVRRLMEIPIRITEWDGRAEGIKVVLGGVELTCGELERLARNDGFQSSADMADFFRPRLPFSGHYYEW